MTVLTLNNGVEMPALGLGVFQTPPAGLQQGRSVIPKSTKPTASPRTSTFDFELSAEEMAAIDALDTGRGGGPEPDAITLEALGRDLPEA